MTERQRSTGRLFAELGCAVVIGALLIGTALLLHAPWWALLR